MHCFKQRDGPEQFKLARCTSIANCAPFVPSSLPFSFCAVTPGTFGNFQCGHNRIWRFCRSCRSSFIKSYFVTYFILEALMADLVFSPGALFIPSFMCSAWQSTGPERSSQPPVGQRGRIQGPRPIFQSAIPLLVWLVRAVQKKMCIVCIKTPSSWV